MKGCYFLGNGQFQIRNMEERALLPHEIRLKNMAAGICGTDVHIYHGDKGSADVVPPVVLGHEYSGIVLETGCEVKALHPGDHVTVDPNRYCGECGFCRTGRKQLCDQLFAIGVNRDGGFAQQNVVPEAQCYRLGDHVPFRAGAMAEPLSCCLHGVEKIGVHTGETVLVVGGGTIGLLMLQLARLQGASTVIVSEPVPFRREIAMQLGASASAEPAKIAETIKQATGGGGVDVIMECSGNNAAAQQTLTLARKGTRILFFAVPAPEATVQLPLFDVFQKELMISGSFINPDTFQHAVSLLNAGIIQTGLLITHDYALDCVEQAIRMQMGMDSIKVMVLPNGEAELMEAERNVQ
ncbi:MAG: zinc-dependent alcohol dehydrogenase family protein [Eubacteriales bacterium]|nr:zinc-dependent alcohol dehydrogenase family protein [Eubacteriales bacterium]